MSKAFYIGLGLVFGAPTLLQLGMGSYFSYMISGIDLDSQVSADTSFMGAQHIYNTGSDKWEKPGFTYIRYMNDINAGRTVKFSVPVKLKELLKRGETTPSEDLKPIFVQARTKELGRSACENLVRFFAKECLVKDARARKSRSPKRGKDAFDVYYELAFVQKEDFGRLNTNAQVTYEEVQFELTDKVSLNAYNAKTVKRTRTKMFRQVIQRCNKLRELQGNCSITNFDMRRGSISNSAQSINLSAKVTLSYLQGGPLEKLAKK